MGHSKKNIVNIKAGDKYCKICKEEKQPLASYKNQMNYSTKHTKHLPFAGIKILVTGLVKYDVLLSANFYSFEQSFNQ